MTAFQEVVRNNGWIISKTEKGYELGKLTRQKFPARGRFMFSIQETAEETPAAAVKRYAVEFDIDKYVDMWMTSRNSGCAGVPKFGKLVQDAEEIKHHLMELASALAAAGL